MTLLSKRSMSFWVTLLIGKTLLKSLLNPLDEKRKGVYSNLARLSKAIPKSTT